MDAYKTQGNHIMNLKKILPLLLAASLATGPAHAFDSSDPFDIGGSDAQAEKPTKALREVNPTTSDRPMAKAMAAGGVAALLGPIGLLVGPIAIPMIAKNNMNNQVAINSFYIGAVVRGKVKDVVSISKNQWGVSPKIVEANLVALVLGVGGSSDSDRIVIARKVDGYEEGDIVDASIISVEPAQTEFNFNRHKARVIALYCKHDNPVCQNDYESSLGVLSRHTDTEFPPSQYLIDPAIIAADQAKMRKDEADKKAAQNSGGFSLM